MNVKLYELRDGEEIFQAECCISDCFDPKTDMESLSEVMALLEKHGMAYLGGGAGPAFLAVRV